MDTTTETSASHQPQRSGIELLPLLMVGAVAVMLAIAGRIDRGGPTIEAKAPATTEASQCADAATPSLPAAGPVSDAERAKVEGIVRDYLLKQPRDPARGAAGLRGQDGRATHGRRWPAP